jgi:4,5-DOPA dioxygenase extradiol
MKHNKESRVADSTEYFGMMPVLFLGHGSPMNAIEENEFVYSWREIGGSIPKPKAILCISAHWETQGTFVSANEKPETIHDFGGFPRVLYEVQYSAPGSPHLAREIKTLIKTSEASLDMKRGLDHGAWAVIKHLYPDADVPVVQLSLDYSKSPQYHYNLSKDLLPLRKKGVLIIGSGNMIHNLGMVEWDKLNSRDYGFEWAQQARAKMRNLIINDDHKSLIEYELLGREFTLSVPTPEHFLPLLYVLALKYKNEEITFLNDKIVGGSIAMTSVKIWNQ